MTIIKINGDLLKSNEQYIVQQCNCVTVRSKNLAKLVFDTFPYANCYSTRIKNDSPGTIKIFGDGIKNRFVINLFGQYYPGASKENTIDNKENRLKWFRQGLFEISKINKLYSIAFPKKIGCGAAKGHWPDYFKLLEKFEYYVRINYDTKVYLYDNENNSNMLFDNRINHGS